MAKISILMPVYNAEEYLKACLDSITVQSFRDFELLMVDDGSTDHSGLICDEYAARDSRFKVKHQNNKGSGYARNVAIDWAMQSNSEYIVWVDADDLIVPQYLEALYTVINNYTEYNIVQCGFTENIKEYLDKCGQQAMGTHIKESFDNSEVLLREMQNGKHCIEFTVLWNKIYHKRLFQNIRVLINEDISGKMYDDINILWKIYIEAGNCLIIDNILYYYRFVATSIQHKKYTERNLEFLPIYYVVYQTCKDKNLSEYATFLSEKMIFFLIQNLSHKKAEYENYKMFHKRAETLFLELNRKMDFSFRRFDLAFVYHFAQIWFGIFRLYGCSYSFLRQIKRLFAHET